MPSDPVHDWAKITHGIDISNAITRDGPTQQLNKAVIDGDRSVALILIPNAPARPLSRIGESYQHKDQHY
jgi:hypothetical protein